MPPRAIRYARDAGSLFFPGRADDFFERGAAVSEAALCAEMARLAYVKHEESLESERLRRILDKVGFTVHRLLDADGTQGFIADGTSDGQPVRIIAFRGTEPDAPRDTIADLDAFPRRWEATATVHRGFARALSHVQDQVSDAIATAAGRVVLTGHSLGAALATLVASLHPPTRLYTFGSPRVGDAAFTAMIAADRQTRYVDCVDVVTTVPSHQALFGYVHLEPASFIDVDGIVHPDLSDDEIRRRQKDAGCPTMTALELAAALRKLRSEGTLEIPLRHLTDHAPINYVAPLTPLVR